LALPLQKGFATHSLHQRTSQGRFVPTGDTVEWLERLCRSGGEGRGAEANHTAVRAIHQAPALRHSGWSGAEYA